MKRLTAFLLGVSLLCGGSALAVGTLSPAANPPQPITVLSTSGIPFIKASSGSMGNNGAVTALTALPRIYTGGAYLWLPAGAIATGVPASASWYWFVGSSTTAGTVYNSTYTSGHPQPGVATAFATTGPGAFAGDTGTVTGPSITVPANLMGRNGRVEVAESRMFTNSAGNKVNKIKFGGTDIFTTTETTQISHAVSLAVAQNRGVTNAQSLSSLYSTSDGGVQGKVVVVDGAIATTADTTVTFTYAVAVATDYSIVENYRVTVIHAD
jgi:hypothetical protein